MHPLIRIGALVLAVLLIPLTGLLYFSLGHFMREPSIGIIGGADGPTAIFITGPLNLGLLFIVTVIVFGLGAFTISHKRKRDNAIQGESENDEEEEV